jgi:oligopeptidase A
LLLSGCPLCREVETLFHEFGHALQHMLTNVNEGLVAGIR